MKKISILLVLCLLVGVSLGFAGSKATNFVLNVSTHVIGTIPAKYRPTQEREEVWVVNMSTQTVYYTFVSTDVAGIYTLGQKLVTDVTATPDREDILKLDNYTGPIYFINDPAEQSGESFKANIRIVEFYK